MNNDSNISYPRILPTGDRALSVEFGDKIDEEINSRLMGLIKRMAAHKIEGIEEFVPSFRAVLIHYNPAIIPYNKMVTLINGYLDKDDHETVKEKRIVEVPVCYEGEYAPDINFVAEHANMTVEEVIKIHSSKSYLVYMLGFQPGFPYLGGLDERLVTPRLENPRLKIDAGSVGIGGAQTGLYPMESPGGWQIIGRTPVKCFNPAREVSIPYRAGDYIRFVPVSYKEYEELKKADANGTYEFKVIVEGRNS